MKKFLFFNVIALIISLSAYSNGEPLEQNYTIPSWTLYKRALVSGKSVEEAKDLLISKNYPYNVNTTINGDPSKQMGIAWFTNAGVTEGVVQIVEGRAKRALAFFRARTITAFSVAFDTVNYVSAGSNNRNSNAELITATGFTGGEKRSYTSNKALIDNLKPNTVYSYRVGKIGFWSEIGSFTTASGGKDEFEFIYITDTQASNDASFDASQRTVEAAYRQTPEARFMLITGDLVSSSSSQTSEWEWEQWFEKLQNVLLRLPVAAAQGNHDTSPYNNMFYHFNADNSFNAQQTGNESRTNIGGTVYSFVYGDALFMVVNYEDYRKGEPYFAALERWMRKQVADNPGVKWRIAAFHKAMFTGGNLHQDGGDARIVRERMLPVFQEIDIDFAIQGHGHIYEVIGVLSAEKTENGVAITHLPDAVSGQRFVEPTFANGATTSTSATGKEGGTFNVASGTLYFMNNSAGMNRYYPRSEQQMQAALPIHGIPNYYELFNKFGQPNESTFSRVKVSTNVIEIETYTVNNNGETALFDSFRVVKN